MPDLKALHIKCSDITSWMLILSVCFLVATLPFGYTGVHRIAIYILLGTFVIDYIASGLYKGLHWSGGARQWYFLLLILFFLLQFIFRPMERHLDYFSQICEDRLSFLAIGVIGIMGINRRLKLKYVAWTFLVTAFACCLFLLSFSFDEWPEWYTIRQYLADVRNLYFSSHMLFNSFVNVAIVSGFYILHTYKNRWLRAAVITIILVLLATTSLSEGRMGFVCSIIIAIYFASVMLWRWRKWSLVFTLIPLIAATLVIINNERLSNSKVEGEPRVIIWEDTLEDIKENPLGMGASTAAYTTLQRLAKLEEDGVLTDEIVRFAIADRSIYGAHAHNQYLQSTLEYGPIGALLLLAIFIMPIFICNRKITLFTVAICFIYAGQLLTDILVCGFIPIGALLLLCLLVTYDVSPDDSGVN